MIRQRQFEVYIKPYEIYSGTTISHNNLYVLVTPKLSSADATYTIPIGMEGWMLCGIVETKRQAHELAKRKKNELGLKNEYIKIQEVMHWDYNITPFCR
ncbi:MAG: hypothetical protein ATN35_02150 [Epulopiscium sp. Nele67-Bin004]|nr:MAG: hypothetical protein ATN35_02150 [Epulopiscium sp. Nele67-Bin004]